MNKKFITYLIFSLSFLVFISCTKRTEKKHLPHFDPSTKFEAPVGADPSIPAELGGNGFTGDGWETNVTYNTIGSDNAVKGGTIIMPIREFPSTIRAHGEGENNDITRMIQRLMYESLLTLDPITRKYVPLLATHWKISTDHKEFKFRINPYARWADGTPVTANDFIATFKLKTDSTLRMPDVDIFRESYEMPIAESKYIVSIKAKEVGWMYFDLIALMNILPAHYLDKIGGAEYIEEYNFDYIPGTGPYYILKEDVKQNSSITIKRRPDYWGTKERFAKGLYNFDEIKLTVVTDDNLMFEKLKVGEVDVINVGSSRQWNENTNFDEVERGLIQKQVIYTKAPPVFQGIAMNMRKPPFDDIKVRRAFCMLFDRKKFNEKLFYNSYTLNNSYFPGTDFENPNNPIITYNPKEAVKLLEEAGWKNKTNDGYLIKEGKIFEVDLPFDGGPGQEKYLTIFQEDLKKVGIKLNLKPVDGNTKFTLGNERNFTLLPVAWELDLSPSIDINYGSVTADQPNSPNFPGFRIQRIDTLADLYNKEFDFQKRAVYVREVDSLLAVNYPYILMWYGQFYRLLYQNKFSYPECVLPKYENFWAITYLWYYDKDKDEKLKQCRQDKNLKMEKLPEKINYWK